MPAFQWGNASYLRSCRKRKCLTGFGVGLVGINDYRPNRDIVIQGNFFGVDETASFLDNPLIDVGMTLYNVSGLTIGGNNAADGNVICAGYISIHTNYQDNQLAGITNVANNKIGTDITGTKTLNGPGASGEVQLYGYNDGGGEPGGTIDIKLTLENNIIGSTVSLLKLRDTFFIKRNHFGVGADNVTNISAYQLGSRLSLYSCNQGIIGGQQAGDKNYFANLGAGIAEWHTGNTTISGNSFQCNRVKAIDFYEWSYNRVQPYINIT